MLRLKVESAGLRDHTALVLTYPLPNHIDEVIESSNATSVHCQFCGLIHLVFISVFQTCALQSREADQVPSSNPDSPHQSFDGCSFDSDGKLLVYNPNPTPTRRNFGTLIDRYVIMAVYHLPKNSGNFVQNVNAKTISARPTGKFSK